MRYLTEIRDENGRLLPFLFVEIEDIGKYSFSAYDTETQKTVDVDTKSNCLGITTFEWDEIEYVVAAVHNKNAAELCRFVEFTDTQSIYTRPYVHDDSDICYEIDRDRNVISNTTTLTVELDEETMVLGECGSVVARMLSVVLRKPGEENRAYTLYDFLLNLCRVCMLNVMSYEVIRLVDTIGSAIMTIKLVHSPEADEFFTKMYVRAWGNSFTRYVSDIRVDGKHVDHAIWPCESNLVVTTKNMDTGVTEEVSDFPIDDCYGFSPKQYNGNHVIVCHSAQAARLYKYIKLAKTYLTIPESSPDADSCYLYESANFNTPHDAPLRMLRLDSECSDDLIGLYEPCGSVVCVENVDQTFVKYLSLYDFLILLCRSVKLNIMSYGTVQIHTMLCDTEIIFDHGKEADRFFTKMGMLG